MSQDDLESSEAPAGVSPVIRFFIERTAVLVCEKGLEYEKKCLAKSVGNPDFSFLWSSDPNHEFYQHKISEYKHRQQQQQNQDGGECKGDAPPDLQAQSPPKAPEFPKSRDGGISPELVDWFKGKDLLPLPPTKYIVMLPRGVTRKEVYTIKLTAQFVARHGMDFERTLMKSGNMDSRFEFMKPTDSRFSYFNRLAAAYSAEFPPGNSNTLTACTATVVEDFFRRLQSDDRSEEEMLEMEIQKRRFVKLQEELLHKEGRELALIDFSELVSKFYPEIQPRMPGEPEPKRQV